MQRKVWLVTLAALMGFGSAPALAETEHVLFHPDGTRDPNYQRSLYGLAPGDRVRVGARVLTLGEKRGKGSTAVIFSLGDGKAVRLALGGDTIPFLKRYQDVQDKLAKHGTPGLKVFSDESEPERFLVVEDWGSGTETLRQVVRRANAETPDPEAVEKLEKLVAFAERLAPFSAIADFGDEQIRFHAGEWKVGDADLPIAEANHIEDASVLVTAEHGRRLGGLSPDLKKRIAAVTEKVRRETLCLKSFSEIF